MESAALGLTCKDAFQVFSQNETLRLQAKVQRLQAEAQRQQAEVHRLQKQLVWACNVMGDAGIQIGCNYAHIHIVILLHILIRTPIRIITTKSDKDSKPHLLAMDLLQNPMVSIQALVAD